MSLMTRYDDISEWTRYFDTSEYVSVGLTHDEYKNLTFLDCSEGEVLVIQADAYYENGSLRTALTFGPGSYYNQVSCEASTESWKTVAIYAACQGLDSVLNTLLPSLENVEKVVVQTRCKQLVEALSIEFAMMHELNGTFEDIERENGDWLKELIRIVENAEAIGLVVEFWLVGRMD